MKTLVSFGLLLIGLYGSHYAWGLGVWTQEEPGAGLFPFMFSVLLSTIMGVELATAGWAPPSRAAFKALLANRRLLAYLAALLLYVASFQWLGFALATVLAFCLIMRVGERLPWSKVAFVTTVAMLLAYLMLQRFLGVPLPTGLMG